MTHQAKTERDERRKFYKGKDWEYLRRVYAKEQDFICERCGRPCYQKSDESYKRLKAQGQPVMFGIVHHKIYLNSISIQDNTISLEKSNLEYLCVSCHTKEHLPSKPEQPAERREDVSFDDMGNIIFED